MSHIANNLWCCFLSVPVVISVASAFVMLGFKSDVITPCYEQLCAKVVIESLLYETARKSSMLMRECFHSKCNGAGLLLKVKHFICFFLKVVFPDQCV